MTQTQEFAGRRIAVAGGSRGIGRAIAIMFARAGARVSICARGAEALEATRAELGEGGHAATCDLADGEAIKAWIASAADTLGGIDILVNNASGFGRTDDDAGWTACFEVDMLATVRASNAALPHLRAGTRANIINISSISAMRPSKRNPPYGAAKAAVIHYTTSQAAMLAREGIRVNAIAPGSIEFPGGSWEQRKTDDPALYNRVLDSIPFGRLGVPEEVGEAALFLASDRARWITGQTLVVDGGQLLGV